MTILSATSGARWRALALLSAIFGAGVSVYLLVEYTTGQPGLCLTGSGCDDVRASAFAYPLGIPMPLLGVAFYGAASWLAYRSLQGGKGLLLAAAVAGVTMSVVLTALEAFVIGAFCTWCLASAAASLLLLVGAVGVWLSPATDVAAGTSSRARQQRARAEEADRDGMRRLGLWGGTLTGALFAALLAAGALGAGPGAAETGDDLAPVGAPRLGTGAVMVVEFADFQCPACAVVGPMLQQMAEAGEMTLVFRHFPLTTIHANADASARAAEAAEGQGAFYAFAEALYARQGEWSNLGAAEADAYFAALAGELGLDVEAWRSAYRSAEVRSAVQADASAAMGLNLPGTPTIYIGGELYKGERSVAGFRAAIAGAAAAG